jgi:hypothetical protein
MSSFWQSDSTIIHRFRIGADHSDLLSARRKVARVLGGATLRPSRLPTSAILFVRKLRDAPSVSRISDTSHGPLMEWERSVNAQLDRLVAEAVRAADHPVPASAEAVIFAERAEMLACLALDWLRGSLRTNWWWSTLLASGDAESLLAREWLASPEFVPHALEHLANRSRAISLAEKISGDLAANLLDRVNHVFGIPPPKRSPRQQLGDDTSSFTAEEILPGPISPLSGPWSLLVPEADAPGLSFFKRIFLAQTLMISRAPSQARSLAFQTALAVWCAAASDQRAGVQQIPGSSPAPQKEVATVALTPNAANRTTPPHPLAAPPSNTAPPGTRVSAPAVPQGPPVGPTTGTTEPAAASQLELSAPSTRDPEYAEQQADAEYLDPPALNEDPRRLPSAPPTEIAPTPNFATQAHRRVSSDLAGVFFLINVALWLGLYSDFTAPLGENLELDLWDLLCLLAARYVGDDLCTDNLNTLFAELAGRATSEPAGVNFRPPAVWEISQTWLRDFPEPFTPLENMIEGQTRLLHPAGFALKQAPNPNAGAAELLQNWTAWIAAYIRARLARAIGRDDAAEFLCRVSGSVEITPMRIDIHYSLQTHPIEIRLAGLDRDPGWIPAAGRYVAYHFH